jgi:hypothetical protein
MKLFTYIVNSDTGLAPNPFWGRLSLAVCKPKIRKAAKIGDWIIGTGSKNVKSKRKAYTDYSGKLVFAMKVSEIMTMKEYDIYCTNSLTEIKNKIPSGKKGWKTKIGDCIYKYPTGGNSPILRHSLHSNKNRETDLGGLNVLLSDIFFYFGCKPKELHPRFSEVIKTGIGHTAFDDLDFVRDFECWVMTTFEKQSDFPDPQLKDEIDDLFHNRFTSSC